MFQSNFLWLCLVNSEGDQIACVLALESSCDETAVAVLRGDGKKVEILSSEIVSQIELHRDYGGVVPELASRNHSNALRPLIQKGLDAAGVSLESIDCFAATAGPGLASSLLIGHTAAKALALACGKPFVGVNHMEGHLLSPFIESPLGVQPNLSLVVSGGHTMLVEVADFGDYRLRGKTQDDAAGEAFDKVGKMLSLPYPGGPEIEKWAREGNPKAFDFPRSMLRGDNLDFSFSGVKTAVLYTLSDLDQENGQAPEDQLADLCASFQEAVIDVLVKKTMKAAQRFGCDKVTVSGGVACNGALRERLIAACESQEKSCFLCSPRLSTDNAVMIAYVGLQKHLRGQHSELTEDIHPNLPLNTIVMRK